jgi:hypothetical protein
MAMLIMGAFSCQKEENSNPIKTPTNHQSSEGMTKVGKQLENPYSVENMRKAWNNVKASNSNLRTEEIEITTTHLYVKFKPKDELELAILKRDTSLILFEYPLDHEIIYYGSFYRDPEVPIGTPTYRYASVKVDQQFPKEVNHEILSELFIPDEEKDDASKESRRISTDIVDRLVDEALKITNNFDKELPNSGARIMAASWRPKGTIRVWDDVIGNWRGVEGVEVKATRWFTTHKGITNINGFYSCNGTFERQADYRLDWERYDFGIREGWLDGANILRHDLKGDWNLDINDGAKTFHARIFMAAYHYYYKEIQGLRRPPDNGILKTQMHIRAYNEANTDVSGNHLEERRFLGLGSQIKIFNPQVLMSSVYATTIHELAHASHWNMWRQGEDFDNSEKIVKESWASGVEWVLTRMVYPGYANVYGRRKGGSSDPFFLYTGVVEDMINGIGGYDQVNGYSIRQIEDALQGQKNWNGWRDNIKNRYENATENNVDALFDFWN